MPTATLNRIGLAALETFKPPKMLIARYMHEHACSSSRAKAVFEQTKIFLLVCASNLGRRHAPSKIIDEMWHEFILFTHEYFAFCRMMGVGYIHHRPTKGADHLAYHRTRQAITAEFGYCDQEFWPVRAAGNCTGDPECGSCEADSCVSHRR